MGKQLGRKDLSIQLFPFPFLLPKVMTLFFSVFSGCNIFYLPLDKEGKEGYFLEVSFSREQQ